MLKVAIIFSLWLENILSPFTFHSPLDLRVIHLEAYILVFHRPYLHLFCLLKNLFRMDTCKMDCPNLIKEWDNVWLFRSNLFSWFYILNLTWSYFPLRLDNRNKLTYSPSRCSSLSKQQDQKRYQKDFGDYWFIHILEYFQ